jgi:Uma2 family endonuclease
MVVGRTDRLLTPEEYLVHPLANRPSELVRGEIREMTPASGAHGVIAAAVFRALDRFVEERKLGLCFPDNTGFALPGLENTVRSPDAAFVRAGRLPANGIGTGWMTVAPDLAVEIVSPTETTSELEEKLRDYRAAGTALIWVIDPVARIVSVQSAREAERRLAEADVLDGGDVLPGFSIPVARLFERLAR